MQRVPYYHPAPIYTNRRALALTVLFVGLVIAAICFRKGFQA